MTLGLAAFLAMFAGYVWLCQVLFDKKGIILNLVYPLSAIIIVYFCVTTYIRYISEKGNR